MVSIIIPTLNEASVIGRTLDDLAGVEGDFEVIVADGESNDATRSLARARNPGFAHPLRVIACPPPRAAQLNRAAAIASGDVLLFIHADVNVPRDAIVRLQHARQQNSVVGGNFQIIFDGGSWVSRLFTWIYRVRRPFGIYYGDSGIFVLRKVFERMGGFKPLPIMDDYEFVRRLERKGKTVCVNAALIVSDRRWRVQGLFRTLFSWVWIQTLFSLGVSPERLAARYRPIRECGASSSLLAGGTDRGTARAEKIS